MKIPKEVRIGGTVYQVKRVKIPLSDNRTQVAYGLQKESKCELVVTKDEKVDKQIKESKFIHEVLHAIDADRSLGLSEDQTNSLANGIYQAFRSAKLNFRKK